MANFDVGEISRATGGFSPSRIVGKGSHGCVYKGIFEERKINVAAVKTSSSPSTSPSSSSTSAVSVEKASKLENEIRVLSSLAENPNIIGFVGMAKNLLVMEFMPNGSLHHLLHSATAAPPSWPHRLEIALKIARGVRFLHEESAIIHRDIKPENVLFDSRWNAKLADFGLAVPLGGDSEAQPAGTLGYLDPDYTSPSRLSTKIDVYSFGALVLELVSGGKAFDVVRVPASIVDWAVPLVQHRKMSEVCDRRVALPLRMEDAVVRVLDLAARCVSPDAKMRPSFSEIVSEIEASFAGRARIVPIWINVLLARRWRKRASCYRRESAAETSDHGDGDTSRKRVVLIENFLILFAGRSRAVGS